MMTIITKKRGILLIMDTNFVMFLIEEMDRRGWSNSELARRAGIVPSTLSKIISGHNKPGLEFCIGVARAFDYPPERVLRQAKLLPGGGAEDDTYDELLEVAKNLSQAELEHALEYLLWRYQVQEAEKQKKQKRPNAKD